MIAIGEKEYRNLQEQVLKNAQDIETLKARKNLQVVIVEELPEVGNPNYIYLVPNDGEEELDVYEEYIWLEDEERYEQIGGVSIDLTNLVTLNGEQEITGSKTFTSPIIIGAANYIIKKDSTKLVIEADGNTIEFKGNGLPSATTTYNLGNNDYRWNNLYVATIDLGSRVSISVDSSSRLALNATGVTRIKVGTENTTYCNANWTPDQNNTYSLGRSGITWKDLYLSGNISDGINNVAVVDIAKKTSSTYASGTFDANGESTYDLGFLTPTGLFVFTYGNCQCFLRLTSAMITASSLTPIRISCPMIYNGNPVSGWLEMSKSGSTLTVAVKDSTNHVDSGYSWTLEKLDLL